MAFRIHDSVVRGEIDNRVKGVVRGKIWVHRRKNPVVLELKGNACADLAGCLLTFKNPLKRIPHEHLKSLNPVQRGNIGDLTASRKVRVFDVPLEEALAMLRRKETPPEHLANSLYLEWFSEANGRVVIESADYELTVSAPEWRLTPEEDVQRAKDAASGMNCFMQQLSEAIEQHQQGQKDPEESWDEHDYERFLKECDARTDKYMELLDKYGDSPEAEQKIAEEMGWDAESEPADGADSSQLTSVEEVNALCEMESEEESDFKPDPAREGIDWIRTTQGDLRHPLQNRCYETSLKFYRQVDSLRLKGTKRTSALEFAFELKCSSAKLAGALNGFANGRELRDGGFTVAYLKRALDHLHKSQSALEAVAPKKLLPPEMITTARKELFELREGILKLMDEFRGRA